MALRNRRSYRALRLREYKGLNNAWLAPNGNLYDCGYMGHNDWAIDYIFDKLANHNLSKADELTNGEFGAYPYQYLHHLGWYRLLTWTSGSTKLLSEGKRCADPSPLTSEQKDTLLYWCNLNGVDYDTFIRSIND